MAFPLNRITGCTLATAAVLVAGCGGTSTHAADRTTTTAGAPMSGMPSMSASSSRTTSPAASSTGSTGSPTAIPTPIKVAGHDIQYHGQQSVVGRSSVQVTMRDVYFEPSVLVGSPGQQLTVNLVNKGSIEHTYTIQGQHVDVVLGPGKSAQVHVTFPQSGRTPFICRFHVGAGMAGILAVTP